MVRFRLSLEIERPVEDVFEYVTDPAKLPEWQTNAVDVENLTGGLLAVGTRLREVHVALGRRLEPLVASRLAARWWPTSVASSARWRGGRTPPRLLRRAEKADRPPRSGAHQHGGRPTGAARARPGQGLPNPSSRPTGASARSRRRREGSASTMQCR